MVLKNIAGVLTLAILVSGCAKGIFSKYSPDEFAVSSKTPLTLPPDYDLHPPLPKGAKNNTRRDDASKQALTGIHPEAQNHVQSDGETKLVEKIGKKEDPFLREHIEKQTKHLSKQENIKIGEVTGEDIRGYDESLDPEIEAQRLGHDKKTSTIED
jgi:hypothetical protein